MKFLSFLNRFFKENLYVIIILVLYYSFFGYILFIGNKGDFSLWLNSKWSPELDFIFKYMTYIGDGVFLIILTLILIVFSPRIAIALAFTYSFSGMIAQILKRLINSPRPKMFFDVSTVIHYVDDVEIFSFNSFPSGHTASAFGAFIILAAYTRNKFLKILFFVIAFLVGISRIYLMQHFLLDVYVGSLIGLIIGIVVYYIVQNSYQLNSAWWIDYSYIKALQLKASQNSKD